MAKDKPTGACIICGNTKDKGQFYKNSSSSSAIDYHPLCKPCIKKQIYNSENGQIDVNKVKDILKLIKIPFIESAYMSALTDDKETFGVYVKNFAINKTYQNDNEYREIYDLQQNNNVTPINISTQILENEDELHIRELQKFWGRGYDLEQYESLQSFYDDFITGYECDSPAQVLNFKNAAKTQLQADEALAKGNVDMYNKLMKTLSTILGDSNVKPVQSTGAEANDQITFGVLIKKYENERPIPRSLDDEMKRYIDTYMVGHLAKMEGLNNELVDMYEEAIKDYTVDFNEELLEDEE